MPEAMIGYPVQRREDAELLTGQARYVADLPIDGCLSAVFVRSPVAHGALTGVDLDDALAMNGVIGVYVAQDLGLPPIPETVFPPMTPRPEFSWPPLATGRVRFVGEAIAVVVADSLPCAVDAAELVFPNIEPLPVITDPAEAVTGQAPLLFPETGSNVVIDIPAEGENALAGAEIVVHGRFLNQRVAPVPMETNAFLALPTETGWRSSRAHRFPSASGTGCARPWRWRNATSGS